MKLLSISGDWPSQAYVRYARFEEREAAAELAIEEEVGNDWDERAEALTGNPGIYRTNLPIPSDVYELLRGHVCFEMAVIRPGDSEFPWYIETINDRQAARRRMRGVFGVAQFSLSQALDQMELER